MPTHRFGSAGLRRAGDGTAAPAPQGGSKAGRCPHPQRFRLRIILRNCSTGSVELGFYFLFVASNYYRPLRLPARGPVVAVARRPVPFLPPIPNSRNLSIKTTPPNRNDPKNSRLSPSFLSPRLLSAIPEISSPTSPSPPPRPAKMHLWPSLRIRDSFKHAYLQKLEFNLAHMKRAQPQRQGQDQDQQQPPGDGKAPLLEGRPPSSSRGSMVASALELAWDTAMLLTCCCCCFCCGACGDEDDHPSAR